MPIFMQSYIHMSARTTHIAFGLFVGTRVQQNAHTISSTFHCGNGECRVTLVLFLKCTRARNFESGATSRMTITDSTHSKHSFFAFKHTHIQRCCLLAGIGFNKQLHTVRVASGRSKHQCCDSVLWPKQVETDHLSKISWKYCNIRHLHFWLQ